jgi:hypothetical protein
VDIDEHMAQSNARARDGRRAGRDLIVAVVMAIGLAVFLTIAAPNSMGRNPVEPGAVYCLPLLGVLGIVIGLAWMIRIHRADPEPDPGSWRYRR